MGTTVDSLEIQLQAQAGKANTAIDTLISKLGTLNTSLTHINGSSLSGLSNGVDKLSRSMQGLKNVGAADYTRLAKGIGKIASLDSGQISKAATAIVGFGKGLQSLNSVDVSKTSKQVAELSKGIAQLGYSSSTKAIENIPKLATAMRQLMSELTKAPKVSQNLIDMTNALAKLARTGASSGRAANALGGSLNTYTKSTHKASRGTKGLASALGKMYATYWLLFRFVGKIGDSITIASDLVEVQNVVETTFGEMAYKVEEYAKNSIRMFGMSELSFKQYASRFQAMGSAMGIDTSSIESANSFLNKSTDGYIGLSDSMADVSINLTRLTADMASLYNLDYKDVADDLTSIFTGETRPLRTYGLDLTQATLAEWAMKNGLDANVQSMSQAEKTMLRYQYVLSNTKAAHGDFIKTINSFSNQMRILRETFVDFSKTIGTGFMAMFLPVIKTLNIVMLEVISFTENIINALGQIFGWKVEIQKESASEEDYGFGSDLSDAMGDVSDGTGNAAGNAGDLSDNLGDAVENAKKLKTITLGIDELNINAPQDDKQTGGGSSGGSGGSGGGGIGSGAIGGLNTSVTQTESMLKEFESSIKTLEQLGEYIGDTLTNAMNKIPWTKVYDSARNFGKGLADFLNGLISPELFGATGRTIANSLNTAIYTALSFGEEFDFYEFGESIAEGINEFFRNFDFESLAKTLNVWADGLEESLKGALKNLDQQAISDGLSEFFNEIELDTILVGIGILKIKKIKNWIFGKFTGFSLKGLFTSLFSGGVTISGLLLKIGSVALGFAGTPVGDVTASWILEKTKEGLDKIIPQWAQDILGNIGAGIVTGAVAGSWFPGAGTIAGMIVGGITGAIGSIKIDGKSILKTITDQLFNWNLAKEIFDEMSKSFKKAFSGNKKWYEIGGQIIKGIGQGILGALVALVEPIADLFDWTWKTICNVFGIHSPAKSMYPIGENILYGIIEGFKSVWDSITNVFSVWYEEKIKPWFTLEKWKKLGENVKNGFSDISGFFDGIWGNIKKTFFPVDEWFKQKFDSSYKNVTNVFSPITNWFGEKWRNTKDKFKDTQEFFRTKFTTGYSEVKTAFNPMNTWFHSKWDAVKNVFRDVKDFFYNKFLSAYNKIVEVFTPITAWFQNKWNGIKNVFWDLVDWFWSKFQSGYNAVTSTFAPIINWFSGVWNGIKNVFWDLTSWFSTGFQNAYNAVTRIWYGIKGFFSKVANWIIAPIEGAVNGVIKGINWVFEAVGAKAPLSLWNAPRFATGSNGLPSDTIGVVNDQAGPTYKELIVPPHGKPFIPEGRNVMLPMEKGTKIMPAGQTKALMNGMPKFAGGIGDFFGGMWEKVTNFTGDVLDYITHPSKIVQIAIDKFTNLSNIGSFFIPLATGAVNKLFDTVVNFVSKMFDNAGGAEKAVKWAIGIANDNSHGYDQANRWGNPDYDCSSLVITAFEKAGIKMKSSGATYTGNMYSIAKGLGFADVTSGVNLGNGSGMTRGDILLNRQNHTAMYIGNGKVVQASSNEKGGIRGGRPGDQTGQEINVSPYYNYPWDDVLRFVKRYKDGIGRISISDLIPKYSVGGFPEDGLFMANHNELVGQFSDGRTAVANNLDIQKGIENAAYRGFSRANAENREQENLLRELIQAVRDGKRIVVDGRELVSITDSRRARNGYSFT